MNKIIQSLVHIVNLNNAVFMKQTDNPMLHCSRVYLLVYTVIYWAIHSMQLESHVQSKSMSVLLIEHRASAVPTGRLCWVSAYISTRLGRSSIAIEHLREEEHAKAWT